MRNLTIVITTLVVVAATFYFGFSLKDTTDDLTRGLYLDSCGNPLTARHKNNHDNNQISYYFSVQNPQALNNYKAQLRYLDSHTPDPSNMMRDLNTQRHEELKRFKAIQQALGKSGDESFDELTNKEINKYLCEWTRQVEDSVSELNIKLKTRKSIEKIIELRSTGAGYYLSGCNPEPSRFERLVRRRRCD